jgi:hypothetical protein
MHIIYFIKTYFCMKVAGISVKKQAFGGVLLKMV